MINSKIANLKLRVALLILATGAMTGCGSSDMDSEGYYEPGDAHSSGGDTTGGTSPDGSGTTPVPGQLTAGEWRDLDHWDFWLDLMDQGSEWAGMLQAWGMTLTRRVAVDVVSGGLPVVDTEVLLRDGLEGGVVWTARTDNRGRAELFLDAFGARNGPYQLEVDAGDGSAVVVDGVVPTWPEAYLVEVPTAGLAENVLDLMLVMDTTGSMGDELRYLQSELGDVLQRVRDAHGQNLVIRLSVNFYRDHGDVYVLRSFPFSTDLQQVLDDLHAQSSDGGGDWEEAVEEALEDAIS